MTSDLHSKLHDHLYTFHPKAKFISVDRRKLVTFYRIHQSGTHLTYVLHHDSGTIERHDLFAPYPERVTRIEVSL